MTDLNNSDFIQTQNSKFKIEEIMELSPKQQTVELIKKSKRILLLGHKEPSADMISSLLAFAEVLEKHEKTVDLIISEEIPENIQFLPFLNKIKRNFQPVDGKTIRINTKKIPISGMKYQKSEGFLDVILETDKNLKFEFLEIINGSPKPDLIIVLDTADVEKIDQIYDRNTELFFETPVINIDHHAGNEYFGTVNLVDLTATSTAEILVSIFEALDGKFLDPDIATCLLTGITDDTQSFKSQNTTPKSLTVAAQFLASGARQQEIISNLYKQKSLGLLKLWGKMLTGIKEDKNHRFAWTKVELSDIPDVVLSDIFDATDELLSNTPDADVILVLCETKKGNVVGKLKGVKGSDVLLLAKLFEGTGTSRNAEFKITERSLDDAEKYTLKKLFDFWGEAAPTATENQKKVWDVIEKEATEEKPKNIGLIEKEAIEEVKGSELLDSVRSKKEVTDSNSASDVAKAMPDKKAALDEEDVDAIDNALKSLVEKHEKEKKEGFSSLGEVIEKKKRNYLGEEHEVNPHDHLRNSKDEDVFEESD